jgi:hypothetical protein
MGITSFNEFKELAMNERHVNITPETSAVSTELGYITRNAGGTTSFAANFMAGWRAAGSDEMKAQRQATADRQYALCLQRHRKG